MILFGNVQDLIMQTIYSVYRLETVTRSLLKTRVRTFSRWINRCLRQGDKPHLFSVSKNQIQALELRYDSYLTKHEQYIL